MNMPIIAWIVLAAVVGLLALGYFYARSMDKWSRWNLPGTFVKPVPHGRGCA